MTAPPAAALDLAWSLRERVATTFSRPLHELDAAIHQAGDPVAVLDANDPARFQRACMLGMAGVTDLALDDTLPEPVRAALRSLPSHYQELLNLLQPAAQALTAAGPDLRNIQNFEGMTGLLHGAAQAANPSTPVGVAAIGGATLGTLMLPGIGTAIGGAIGVWLGGKQVSKRDRLALQRFAAATKLMASAVDDLHHSMWNQLVRSLREEVGPNFPDAAYFETANVHWESLQAALPSPSERAAFRERLEIYFREWGPHPRALFTAAQLCLPPYPLDLAGLEKWVARHRALYPTDPTGHENATRLLLEQEQFEAALTTAARGLEIAAAHPGLREVRLEALAALGRVSEAEEAARLARQGRLVAAPEVPLIRGLMRGGRRAEAIERVRAWVQRDGKPAAIARQLQAFAPTALLLAEGAVPIPELAGVPPGVDGLLQAAVEEHLHADGAKSFLGAPPQDKWNHARDAWLHLDARERLLFFHDWSLWHNAKTGLAISNRRILWKCAWDDTVAVDLQGALGSRIAADQGELHFGGKTVDIQDNTLAASLAQALSAMLQVLRGEQTQPASR
jgi:hypothetical protein